MATAAELLAASAPSGDKTLVIDNYLRMIQIPSGITNLGVENDDDVLRLEFRMPRYLGDIDLSTFAVRINYLNAKGEGDIYIVDDLEIVGSNLTFSWLVGPTATKYKGNTKFNVCMKVIDDDAYVQKEYNTTIVTLPVLEGLEVEEGVVEYYSDVLEQWRRQLFGIGDTEEAKLLAKSEEEQEKIVNKGIEVLDSIPEDYTTTHKMANDAYRNKSDAIVCSESGNAIHLVNSAEDPFHSLKIFGRTKQTVTTGAQIFDATNCEGVGSNVNLNVSDDQYFIMATGGANSGYAFSKFPLDISRCAGKTLIMRVDKLEGQSQCGIMLYGFVGGKSTINYTIKPGQTAVECSIASDVDEVKVYVYSNTTGTPTTANNTVTVKGLMVYEKDTFEGDWEPYSGGVPSPSLEWPQTQRDVIDHDIAISGANLFDQNKITTTTKGGVTITNNGDGSFSISGSGNTTDTCSVEYEISNARMRTMFHSGELRLITDTKTYPMMFVNLYRNGTFLTTIMSSTWSRDYSYTLPPEFFTTNIYSLRIGFHANANTAIIPGTVTPILTQHSGDVRDKYRGSQFTRCQDLEYTPLRGIPVASGGNFTDSNGQQWICDEIDYVKGKYIQRVAVKTLDGSLPYQEAGTQIRDTYTAFIPFNDIWINENDSFIADNLMSYNSSTYKTSPLEGIYTNPGNTNCNLIIVRIKQERLNFSGELSIDALAAYLHDHPVTVYAPLKTPIVTDLDAVVIKESSWLTTYYPRTTILNLEGAEVYAEYNADLKHYASEIMETAAETVITQDKIQSAVDAWLSANFSSAEGVSF